jgi:long-chain acyl-CoA synthetase
LKKFKDLKAIIESAADRLPEKIAIIMGERRVTFASLEEDSNRIAHALIKLGVRKGDRVAMIQTSNPEFINVFFGIIKAGAIAVPLDSRYVANELDRLFNDCRPEVLFVEDDLLAPLESAIHGFGIQHIVTFDRPPADGFLNYRKLLEVNPPSPLNVDIAPDDIAVVSYTGGPTMKPHGVALSQQAIAIEAACSAQGFAQTEDDVVMLFALPMYHQFGLTAVMLGSMCSGNSMVVVPGTGRSVDSFMEVVEREKGTVYMGVPYIYSLMINVARKEGIRHDLSSMRLYVSGGAPLEVEVIDQFQKLYGHKISDIYGQTETVCHVTVMPIDGSGKAGASGKPLACWKLKIFDENGKELLTGQEGEIVARGPVMAGFYGHPDATAGVMRHGWLHTGDIGKIDKEGLLYITGRIRRMLILKGQNVFPADIEEVIAGHPRVADVKVIGVPDIVRGETIKALVRLKPGKTVTEQEIRQYCQGKMSDYKLPREITFVDTLPEDIPIWSRAASRAAAHLPDQK